jgi:ribosomal protein L7/L12
MTSITQPRLSACFCCGRPVSTQAKACPHCGQPDPTGSDELKVAVKEFLREAPKINAIKFVREQTGAGIKEAKDYVERILAEG